MSTRQPIVIGVLLAALIGAAVVDRRDRHPPDLPASLAAAGLQPSAPPANAVSATWYCAGGLAPNRGQTYVVVANPSAQTRAGSIHVIPAQGDTRSVPLEVGPLGVVQVPLHEIIANSPAAALVELDGGEAVAELVVADHGLADRDVVPCASSVSSAWHFADGTTARDASLLLALFNPFPEDAIADLSFATESGRSVPADFQGIVVPGRGFVVKDIGERVRRRQAVATKVLVRSGRLVAAQTQLRGTAGRAGVSVVLGAPAPGLVWRFPDGFVEDGLVERYSVTNPGRQEASVLIEVALDEGGAEPFEVTVPPLGRVAVPFHEEARIPKGVAHAVTVRSLNRVPVVAARTLEGAAPSSRAGRSDTLGSRRSASRWLFADGGSSETLDEWIILVNQGRRSVKVSLRGLADGQLINIEGLQDLDIGPGRRRALRLGDHIKRSPLPVLVEATGPVVAERALFGVGRGGMSGTVGVPLG